jgi:hypothetical protein
MNISNANALNMIPSMDNNDEQDYLQRYEKFYEDDKFREDYYNYHKQHHQQIANKEQLRTSQEPQQNHHHHHKQIEKEKQSFIQKLQQQHNSMIESLTQPGGPTASTTNTRGLESTLSSPPIIAQGTEEDLSALEKIAKLKQQWIELLP